MQALQANPSDPSREVRFGRECRDDIAAPRRVRHLGGELFIGIADHSNNMLWHIAARGHTPNARIHFNPGIFCLCARQDAFT